MFHEILWFVDEANGRVAGHSRVCPGREETQDCMQMTLQEIERKRASSF